MQRNRLRHYATTLRHYALICDIMQRRCDIMRWLRHYAALQMLRPNFTPIFYSRIAICSSNLNEQKKTHQKILIFAEVMACQSLLIFQFISNANKIFPRSMTSLEPNDKNSLYISIHFHYICVKIIRTFFLVRKVEVLFLNQNWLLSSKK